MGGSFAFVQCRQVDMDHLNSKQRLAAWLCGGGIILMFVGYAGVRYLPMTPEERQREELLQRAIPAAAEMTRNAPPEIRDMVMNQLYQSSIYRLREPPYWWPGTIALCLGIGMTGSGLVLWFRNTGRGQRFGWAASNND
jgi:hypothetical protein